jgi:hypothetical protein
MEVEVAVICLLFGLGIGLFWGYRGQVEANATTCATK